MKILLISKFYPPESSARAIQMSRVVASLISHKYCEIHVLAGLVAGDQPLESDNPVTYIEYEKWNPPVNNSLINRFRQGKQNLKRTKKWVRNAVAAGLEITKTYKPDIIFSASNPQDPHEVAARIIKKHPLPWVAFFSDIAPMTIAPPPYKANRNMLNFLWWQKLQRITEHTFTKSNAIVMSNPIALDYMSQKLNLDISHKSFAIAHIGETLDSNASIAIDTSLLEKRIIHIGRLDRQRYCSELIEAARLVHREIPDKFLGIAFIGHVDEDFVNLTYPEERESLFIFTGHTDPAVAAEYTRQAYALLLVEADMEFSPYLPSKMAEYAVNGNNIIAITPHRSPVRQYIEQHGGGVCASRSINEIADAIRQTFTQNKIDKTNSLAENFLGDKIAQSYRHVFETVLTPQKNKP